MENVVNFNRYRPPILKLEMLDDARTVLHVVPPTVDLQEELREKASDLYALLTGTDTDKREALFDLAARLMSRNRNMLAITPESIRTTYRLDEEDMVVFFEEYATFVRGIEQAKN